MYKYSICLWKGDSSHAPGWCVSETGNVEVRKQCNRDARLVCLIMSCSRPWSAFSFFFLVFHFIFLSILLFFLSFFSFFFSWNGWMALLVHSVTNLRSTASALIFLHPSFYPFILFFFSSSLSGRVSCYQYTCAMSENVNPNNPHGRGFDSYPTSSQTPLGPLLTTKQKTVQQLISDLNAIYDKLKEQSSTSLHVMKHHELSITCKELMLSDKGLYSSKFKPCFFDPTIPDVKQHPPIFEPNHHSQLRHESLHEMIDFHMKDTSEARQSAYLLCYEMVWAFDMYPRKGSRDNKCDLRSLTNWLPSRYVSHQIHNEQLS